MWLLNSSIGRKLIMSVSGLFLILFLLFHMSMNLVAVFSTEAYDAVCEFLGINWYALVGTLVLAAGFVIHIVYASILTLQNRKARGTERYAVTSTPKTVEWTSQNMYVLGAIVLGFMVLHLFNFWYKMMFAGLVSGQSESGAELVQQLFANPVYVVLYLGWFVALWFHLTHGFWSMFQSVGWNGKVWFNRLKCISNIFSTIVFLGFALVVVVFFLKSL
ncbi:MAG: succinate dehydrogenase cytochrome b subunit [Bacteroidota bacterium]|nr:succinate dehydrogenase cytochrome b subunit [Parabacteroides sp. FAFU027]MDP4269278.1 succinate dehydrogenase cytochrome b subunit [Bacteroidota bacterium]